MEFGMKRRKYLQTLLWIRENIQKGNGHAAIQRIDQIVGKQNGEIPGKGYRTERLNSRLAQRYGLTESTFNNVVGLIRAGMKVDGVKAIRRETNTGLREALNVYQRIALNLPSAGIR